ncbi:hypothetical protein EJ06DRAFT_560230 [Trichodelitschia bisporula]|uniref:Uncharacterized protein n=1 Tax=Trichodelitschia bisporula TaxID=703511 RepID=A0A6G1HIT7_9PEZI|nr:hypothetical protein EJ06DRAFT_560230 [Trichodelitschia bisporula]
MKSALLLAAVAGLLAPVLADVPAGAQWYTLKTKAKINTLSNQYLTSQNGKIGGFASTRSAPSPAGKFFTSTYEGTKTLSFHFGNDTHQAALSGKGGVLDLIDMENPSAETVPAGVPTEWSVFTIGQGGEVGVKDWAEGDIAARRKWIMWLETDGVYYVGLWDGVTLQPRSFANITLIAEKTTPPS